MGPNKYFLCFGFKNFHIDDLDKFHVTLLYLGVNETWSVARLIEIINTYLSNKDNSFPSNISFDKTSKFGENNDVRVLIPSTKLDILKSKLLNELREIIVNEFSLKTDYPFNPHLTTELKYFRGIIDTLYLCENKYHVIGEWKL